MRKSISVALFSMVSTLLVLGIAVMGCSEWVLFGRYFAQERYEALDGVAGGPAAQRIMWCRTPASRKGRSWRC